MKQHQYNYIYIATDSKDVLEYFKTKNLNIFSFNIFPKEKYRNLHTCKLLNSDDKIKSVVRIQNNIINEQCVKNSWFAYQLLKNISVLENMYELKDSDFDKYNKRVGNKI